MSKKILIVEDYAVNRSFLKFYLESCGYDVLEAANGQEAIESVRQQPPDLILMDLAMPDVDGFAATRAIRKFDGMNDLPIIAVTAYGNLYSQEVADAGFSELISKPFDPTMLDPILSRYLG